ncbi:hypothetical protein SAMN03159341_11867 [Paenibacillus sp. 1_12]|uniref:hypothetical protein n=1 Tax=Paenibacillus sp. 1_12 TaxID=1566278 RepID=UPI0008E23DA3|nr:hypothetical protein [Paenibacillus sp. 1_12]SFM15278.1 hypothetical protein SAMN03159341_11867 [Paenibacillus sp. 1_12]
MAVSTKASSIEKVIPLTAHEKVTMLRAYECSCYQITSFMLRDEKLAVHAAKQILLKLYTHEEWFYMDEAARMAEVRHAALNYSLECRKKALVNALRNT